MNLRFRRAPDARHGLALAAGALMTLMVTSAPARAIEFEYGEFKGSVINTLSAGIQMRVAARDCRFLGKYNGGCNGMTHNGDDNNKHFGQGDIVGAPVKITNELNVSWRNLGFYSRGTAFYDYIYDNNDLAKFGDTTSPTYGRISTAAQRKAAMGAEVQDLFIRGTFDIGTQPLTVRVGQQTLNWGEALFTQNAISIINPLDLQKFAVPGAELRDGLIPVPMAWLSYEIVEGLAVEGFYQWEFKKLRLSPTGTYFGGADVVEESNDGIGGVAFSDCQGISGLCLRQKANEDPGDSGNYGVKLNYYSEALNNTEFGLYFVRYTSRFPSVNYVSNGVDTVLRNVLGAGCDLTADAKTIAACATSSVQTGGTGFIPGVVSQSQYVRGVKMVALSYNTTLEGPGVAVNGEFSYKMDEPGSIYGTTTSLQALCSTSAIYGAYCVGGKDGALNNQGSYFGSKAGVSAQKSQGYILLDVARANARFTKILFAGNPFVAATGAESWTLISETSINYITNLPDSGQLYMTNQLDNNDGPSRSATKVSSYENLLVLVSYPAAFGTPINLTPGMYYGMTIQGNSPTAAGTKPGFKAMNLSLKAEYQQNLTATLNFAKQWGGSTMNNAIDKDFVGLTVNYTF